MRLLLLMFCSLLAATAVGQSTSDSLYEAHKPSIFGLPVVYNTPETSWAFGAAGIYSIYTDRAAPLPTTRPSQFRLAFAYTLNQQILFYLPYEIFTPDNRYRYNGELGYYKYSYFYYGTGNEFTDYEGELYSLTYPRLRINAMKRFGRYTYLGVRYWMDNFKITETEDAGLLAGNGVPGVEGGWLSGLGPVIQWDSRDHIFYPGKGHLLEAAVLFNSGALGSDFTYTKLSVDWAAYLPFVGASIFAYQAYLELNSGQPPFNQLALLGGGKRLRGYYEGRYRDRQMISMQAEWRFPLFWRLKGALFGGAGLVAERVDEFSFDDLRPAFGLGLRYLVLRKERIHIRLDMAYGQNSSAFYLTIGEAF